MLLLIYLPPHWKRTGDPEEESRLKAENSDEGTAVGNRAETFLHLRTACPSGVSYRGAWHLTNFPAAFLLLKASTRFFNSDLFEDVFVGQNDHIVHGIPAERCIRENEYDMKLRGTWKAITTKHPADGLWLLRNQTVSIRTKFVLSNPRALKIGMDLSYRAADRHLVQNG